MCIALTFVDQNRDFELLKKLLVFFKAENYNWIVGDADVYLVPKLDNLFDRSKYFDKKFTLYQGKDLMQIIDNPINYTFLELFAFDSYDNVPKNYSEFLAGNCKIAVVIDDCNYYTIFMKNKNLFNDFICFFRSNRIEEYTILDKTRAELLFGL